MTKKIYVDVHVFVSLLLQITEGTYRKLQKAPFTASSYNLPDYRCSAHRLKYDYFCQKKKRFKCSDSKIYT